MPGSPPAPAPAPATHRRRTWGLVALGAVVVLAVGVVAAEVAGWPFLVGPLQRTLSTQLDRPLQFGTAGGDAGTRIKLFGGVSVQSERIELAAPSWRPGTPMVVAEQAMLRMRYGDLWRASRGQAVRIRLLSADQFQVELLRLADGRANWQLGSPREAGAPPAEMPVVEELRVRRGALAFDDAVTDSALKVAFSLSDGTEPAAPAASGASGAQAEVATARGLDARVTGRYERLPVTLRLTSTGVLPWIAEDAAATPVPLTVSGEVGRARLRFDGRVRDLGRLGGLGGRFNLAGPSLAAVGDVVGVTLPTTPAFTSRGVLFKREGLWGLRFDEAAIGGSRLTAALHYDTRPATPLLIGRVGGPRLLLADLGPAVGTSGTGEVRTQGKQPGRVLPAREFDLPSLRHMDANVLLDFAELDLGSTRLQPLKPLRAHLVLNQGVLDINAIDARTAEGRLQGSVSLDGRKDIAVWRSDLRWSQIRLERWLQLAREPGEPAWITGRMGGRAKLEGRGRSTADILGSMNGELRTQLRDGSISHLLVEAAGLDLAQGLGLVLSGDDALPMSCALADLQVERGVMRPRAMVVDTRDSVIVLDGTVSMADERLDLRAIVSPKDFSPLALRTPLRVRGSLGEPAVSIEPGPLAGKLLFSGLLALLNPLAGLLPLVDFGGGDDAAAAAPGCKALVARIRQIPGAAGTVNPAVR